MSQSRRIIKTSKCLAGAVVLALSACTTVSKVERVAAPVQAREFNSVANAYMVRPTFAEVADMSDGTRILQLGMDRYGGQRSYLMFPSGSAAEVAAFVDKYAEWSALATSRREAITKEIGSTRTWSYGGSGARVKFSMHSGNPTAHYLVATSCTSAICLDGSSHYFDAAGAAALRQMLTAFDAGTLRAADSSVYK